MNPRTSAASADSDALRLSSLRPRWIPSVVLLCALVGLSGCSTYRFGPQSLFRDDVRTVYVPMVESDSLRRYLGERLTEAIVKQLEARSQYKVVGSMDDADSQLVCRLLVDTKRVATETRTDEPRLVDLNMLVQMEWTDRQGQSMLQRTEIPLPAELLQIGGGGLMVSEVGQSIATSQQKVIDRVAMYIVDQMEEAW